MTKNVLSTSEIRNPFPLPSAAAALPLSGRRPTRWQFNRGARSPLIEFSRGSRWTRIDFDSWRAPLRVERLSMVTQERISAAIARAGGPSGAGFASGCAARVPTESAARCVAELEAIVTDLLLENADVNDDEIGMFWLLGAEGFAKAVERAEVEDLERLWARD